MGRVSEERPWIHELPKKGWAGWGSGGGDPVSEFEPEQQQRKWHSWEGEFLEAIQGWLGYWRREKKKQNYTRDIVNKCKTWTSLFTTQLIIRWSLEKLLIFWLVPSFQGSGLCPLCRSTSWGWLAYVVMSVLYLQGSRVPAGGPLRGGTDTGKHIAMEPRQGPGNCSLITGLFLHIYIEDNGYSIQRVLYSY